MKNTLRIFARGLLGFLTTLTIKKHKPTVICILGEGETSIAREILYENIHQKFPARRNLEILEAEFGIPLTVLGILSYPDSILKWTALVAMAIARIFYLKPYKHFLILELPEIDSAITRFWLGKLNPQYILIQGKFNTAVKMPQSKTYKDVLLLLGKLGIDKITKELPQARIKVCKGINNSTIIDATFFYTPSPMQAVLEIIDKDTAGLPAQAGKIILLSDSKKDQTDTLKFFPKTIINPANPQVSQKDIVIIRGNKGKQKGLLSKFVKYL